MAINLSEGSIAMMSSGDAQVTAVKPVLQVFDVRLINTSNQNNTAERYRLVLSDGSFCQQGMLATQRNDLVRSGRLQKGSIVQLTEFVCNVIHNKRIIIIIDLQVIHEKCDPIGEPKQYPQNADGETPPMSRPSAVAYPTISQPGMGVGNPQSSIASSLGGSVSKESIGAGIRMGPSEINRSSGPQSYGGTSSNIPDAGRYYQTNASPVYNRTESNAGLSRAPVNGHIRAPQSAYVQPPAMYTNRGPIAKNEAPPRILPIAALNPYQCRWTIKARVTSKGELRHYNNQRGEGKVFSFDLLDSDGGEIRATCFNAVADMFHHQIEAGKVYLFSKGSLKPAQKNFNHLSNDHEILLDSTSSVQLCEDIGSIPMQKFHFRPIIDIEGMENNSIIDVIGVLCSISPSSPITRKNGTETLKRSLHVKDLSGRSVEVTLWGNFCNVEGQKLQNICDSGVFPVLALKFVKVNDFNGKTVGTIPASQVFIEPDLPEARQLRVWVDNEGRNIPVVSISRETTVMGRTDVRKTISQIKDEKLGTSEKPDWITVSAAVSYLKTDNFCYTACPITIGDRQCSKKVTNNGDGKWRCDRCDKSFDDCDYRYILQFQIQDHTGLTWVTAFQECGEEIMGISAKELYYLKYEEQDDERFGEIVRKILFNKYIFKLKVKEETFSDEQRVKSTVVKAEKLNYISETRLLLDLVSKLTGEDSSSLAVKPENVISSSGLNNTGLGNVGLREPAAPYYIGNTNTTGQGNGLPACQVQYGNQNSSSRLSSAGPAGVYMNCSSCGGSGHSTATCPNAMNSQRHSNAGGFNNQTFSAGGNVNSGAGVQGECFKCHQQGHWARDCPSAANVHTGYGSGNVAPARYGSASNQYIGGF